MPRDYKLYLDDIVAAIATVRTYTTGYDYDQFVADRKTVDAVLHNLAIIGEAASKLPATGKRKAAEIEWRKVVAFRNIVIHEYFGINFINHNIPYNYKLDAVDMSCRRLLDEG